MLSAAAQADDTDISAAMPDTPHTILIVDDDRETCALVREYFERHDFTVVIAHDGTEMTAVLARHHVDLIILDVMLPGRGGFDLCREIRSRSDIPVIMLTAVNELADKVVGLELGADDYVPKPFEPRELLARVRAVIRRKGGASAEKGAAPRQQFRFADWLVDIPRRQLVAPDGVVVSLTAAEFELLAALVQNPQRTLSRDQLLELTTGRAVNAFDRSIDILISRLRRKLVDNGAGEDVVKTIRGGGYLFVPDVKRL
jgi:two-component system, OmpR family, response regulator